MKKKIIDFISLLPSIIVIPYILGFISVNIYFYYYGIETTDALNINYLTIGFFSLAMILVPLVAMLIVYYLLKTPNFTNITSFILAFSSAHFVIGYLELNAFFDNPYITMYIPWFGALGLIVYVLDRTSYQKTEFIGLVCFLLILITVFISWYYGLEYQRKFIEALFFGWLVGILAILLYARFLNEDKNIIHVTLGFIFSGYFCIVLYTGGDYIPNLRISIGGLKPTKAKIFLDSTFKFNTKDTTSTEYKINKTKTVYILYQSDKKIVVEGKKNNIILDASCVKAIIKCE